MSLCRSTIDHRKVLHTTFGAIKQTASSMRTKSTLTCWVLVAAFLCALASAEETRTCSADDDTCSAERAVAAFDGSFCEADSSVYINGGSAQAYRVGAPLSNTVCRPDTARDFRYKPGSWPMSRRSFRKGTAPKIHVALNIQSCKPADDKCLCAPLPVVSAKNASSVVDIWQARPDGRYSPLRQRVEGSDECRAQVPIREEGVAEFSTVAPGSTGVMGGLGPGGWEIYPYGPPVVHLLVRAAGYEPLLLDVPILFDPKTLESRSFSMSDFRGIGWVSKKSGEAPMKIQSWEADIDKNSISVVLDIYVRPAEDDQVDLCESFLYGFPSSFFLEPMSVCAPSMLDFFAL